LIVCSLNASIAGLAIPMLPVIVGALGSKSHIDSRALGLLAFLELGGAAVTSIAVSWQMRRFNAASLCAWGSFCLAAANLAASAAVSSAVLLLVLRLIAGVGTGLMSAGMLALVARVPNPERMYGILGFAPCVSASLAFTLAPNLIRLTNGASGMFLFWGALAAVNSLCLFVYRRRLVAFVDQFRADVRVPAGTPGAVTQGAGGLGNQIQPKVLVFCLACIFLLAFCDSAVWAFVEPIGERIGLSIEGFSRALILTAVVACLGPLLAARIGSRFGVLAPIAIGQLFMIGLSILMVLTREPVLFAATLSLRVIAVLFLVPRYNGLFARIDPIGRVVAAAQGAQGIAYGVGPLVGGFLIGLQEHSFVILGVVAALSAATSLGMTLFVVPRGVYSSNVQAVQV
jgi:MFS family permease